VNEDRDKVKSPAPHSMDVEFDVILQEEDSGYWIASVPSLEGCFTQGKTQEEALERIKQAIALCLRSAQPRRIRIATVQMP
jgi:predicted RNase H-like HicB family nuclease